MLVEEYINCYECRKGNLIHFKYIKTINPPAHIFYCNNCDAIFPLGQLIYKDEKDREYLKRLSGYIAFNKLDKIEQEICSAVASGFTTKNIAKKLGISDRWARMKLRSLLKDDYIREVSKSKTDPTKYYVINPDKHP